MALVTGGATGCEAGGRQLYRAGLDLNRFDLDRLHRLGRARNRRDGLGLDHTAGQRRGLGSGLRLDLGLRRGQGRGGGGHQRRLGRRDRTGGRHGRGARLGFGRTRSDLGFGDIDGAVGGIAFGDRGDRTLGRALIEVLGQQIAHGGVARTAAAAAQHHADEMAVTAAHRAHEVEAGGAGIAGLDAVDAFDIAEQAIVVADRLAAIVKHRRCEIAVVARVAILDRAAERGLIARRGQLFVVGQAGGVAIGGLAHAERARLSRHQLGEFVFVAGNRFRDHDGGVVGGARHQAL